MKCKIKIKKASEVKISQHVLDLTGEFKKWISLEIKLKRVIDVV